MEEFGLVLGSVELGISGEVEMGSCEDSGCLGVVSGMAFAVE